MHVFLKASWEEPFPTPLQLPNMQVAQPRFLGVVVERYGHEPFLGGGGKEKKLKWLAGEKKAWRVCMRTTLWAGKIFSAG